MHFLHALHPASLDGALQATSLLAPSTGTKTRLPFSIEHAMLRPSTGRLWAAVANESASSSTVELVSASEHRRAHLDGFATRELRADSSSLSTEEQHLYVSTWQEPAASAGTSGVKHGILVIGRVLSSPTPLN